MTRFMKLFLSLAAGSCPCGLAQELQVSYTTELQSDFKQGSNWVNLLRLDFTHSLGKHTTLQASTISTARTRTESLADDFQTFSNIEEENHPLALATLGVQQQFGHSSLFFGIRNLNFLPCIIIQKHTRSGRNPLVRRLPDSQLSDSFRRTAL
mgnify:CR=1 FL=1